MADDTNRPNAANNPPEMGELDIVKRQLKELTDAFKLTRDDNRKLQRQIDVLQGGNDDIGAGPVFRHCNGCGEEVDAGKRCPRHPNEKVHEVSAGPDGSQRLVRDQQTGRIKTIFRAA